MLHKEAIYQKIYGLHLSMIENLRAFMSSNFIVGFENTSNVGRIIG